MAQVINRKLFREAKKYIPGGVNSPVRSFQAVGGEPLFIKRGKGAYLYVEAGKKYIDYCLSWGALIFGHANQSLNEVLRKALEKGTSFGANTKLEITLAKLIVEAYPAIEQVRLVNSGTEAVMSAIRLARAYSGKTKIIKFNGAYHGHADYLLVKSGSGLATLGIPESLGVPKDFTKHTITLNYNSLALVQSAAEKYQKDLAAIIVEPVMANCGLIVPQPGFLKGLRQVADKYKAVLIFDEVITGFRLGLSGAFGYFKVKPDLACLGKIIGAGLPIGAFGGKKEIMQLLAPQGKVYQAGTLSGNPLAVSAGIFTLQRLKNSNIYKKLEQGTKRLAESIILIAKNNDIKLKVNYLASMFSLFFTDKEVNNYFTAQSQNRSLFKKLFQGLLKQGVYLSPSGLETNFLSTAHGEAEIEKTIKSFRKAFKEITGRR